MDKDKQRLQGSESRDVFKRQHKEQCNAQFYSLDIDFAFVEKNLGKGIDGEDIPVIVAILDFKMPGDDPTFTEVLAYNRFIDHGIPVYIVETQQSDFVELDPQDHRFNVYKYEGGDWKPNVPTWEGKQVLDNGTWDEFESWESDLRITRRNRRSAEYELHKQLETSLNSASTIEDYKLVSKMVDLVKENPRMLDIMYRELY